MFRNTSTANDKCLCRDLENLLSTTQLQLSFKQKFFLFIYLFIFLPVLKSALNFKHFENKDDHHSYFITEFTGCERLGSTTL